MARFEGQKDENKGVDKGDIFLIIGIVVLFIIIMVGAVVAALVVKGKKNNVSATTIRVIEAIGGVTLTDNGNTVTVRDDMLLYNGNTLETASDGNVDLMLDDTKAAGLDVLSRASFTQDGKKLAVDVETGAIYFYTTEKLSPDEDFDVETSTMSLGLRGTSGYISYEKATTISKLFMTSGMVHVVATNPNTGATTEADVSAGQMVETVFNADGSVELVGGAMTPADIPALLLKKILESPVVSSRVVEETGWTLAELEEIGTAITADNETTESNNETATTEEESENTAEEENTIEEDTDNTETTEETSNDNLTENAEQTTAQTTSPLADGEYGGMWAPKKYADLRDDFDLYVSSIQINGNSCTIKGVLDKNVGEGVFTFELAENFYAEEHEPYVSWEISKEQINETYSEDSEGGSPWVSITIQNGKITHMWFGS